MKTAFDSSHGTRLYSYDSSLEKDLSDAVGKLAPGALEKCFPLYVRRVWLKKFLAHYELFRKVRRLEGDIVELGVFRGLSLFSFAGFNEACSRQQRTVIGVDNFRGFTQVTLEDGPRYDLPKQAEGFSPRQYLGEVRSAIDDFNRAARRTKIELEVGDVENVLPGFARDGRRLALIHFDVDLYVPTKAGLEVLYPLLVPGGVMVFDEYGVMDWGGETRAVDEYFEELKVRIKKFPWQGAPSGYLVKPRPGRGDAA